MDGIWGIIAIIAVGVIIKVRELDKISAMSPDELKQYDNEKWGDQKHEYICPHCQVKGQVYTKSVNRKKGVSGAKATGAILTGGISLLATGLSRKEGLTQAHCCNCDCSWDF